ncbi:MAG: hypothetical protein WKG06_02230 [Segetibacter sp.]
MIPEIVIKRSMTAGLVTCGDVTGAALADFYMHRNDKDSSAAIFRDLASSPVQLIMGSANKSINDTITNELKQRGINIVSSISNIKETRGKKWLLMDSAAGLSILNGRGTWLQDALQKQPVYYQKIKQAFS